MTITFASIFTGGGGADFGTIAAGLNPIWGIEKDGKIATIAYFNCGKHAVYIKDIRDLPDVFWENQQQPDWLHASPPCVNASRANNGKETSEDLELAEAICRAIAILKPKYFSLENVAGYSKFYAFEKIKACLTGNGYEGDFKVLDCSDYGVPQSRKRLFLVAVKGIKSKDYLSRLKKQKPAGWYEAIADLIPTLSECNLTKSQEWRLLDNEPRYGIFPFSPNAPLHLLSSCPNLAIQNSGSRKDKNGNPTNIIRLANEPIWTIKAMSGNVRPNPHQVTLIVDGKVLRPSIECYARWQTFPDSYQWPADFKLAMKICGNAVPPLMMRQIIETVLKEANHG